MYQYLLQGYIFSLAVMDLSLPIFHVSEDFFLSENIVLVNMQYGGTGVFVFCLPVAM